MWKCEQKAVYRRRIITNSIKFSPDIKYIRMNKSRRMRRMGF